MMTVNPTRFLQFTVKLTFTIEIIAKITRVTNSYAKYLAEAIGLIIAGVGSRNCALCVIDLKN